jgi:gluconolactonase
VIVDGTEFINGNAVDRECYLVHCEQGRRCISRLKQDGEPVPILTPFDGQCFNRPNDIALAPDGKSGFPI